MLKLRGGMYLSFVYTNWRGETEDRKVLYRGLEFGQIENFHPEPCFILRAYCLDKHAERSFDVSRIDVSTFKEV